jgi:alpha-galactosidase
MPQDPDAGHSEHGRPGELVFGTTWTVFGPCRREAPAPAAQTTIPSVLMVEGATLDAREFAVDDGRLDLGPVFGVEPGRSAFVCIPFTATRDDSFTFGLGADWWIEAWIDGRPLGSTMKSGNNGRPPSREDQHWQAACSAGEHLLMVRVVSGSDGFLLDVGNPRLDAASHREHLRRLHLGMSDAVLRPLKVVFLGAGSSFLQTLAGDLLSIPGADRGELVLVDIDEERLHLAEGLVRMLVGVSGRDWKVTAATDRRKVLAGTDYIISCIEVSGVGCVAHDNDIPAGYGIDQCIGDTTGPGGLFKALRTVPVFLDVLRDIQRLCPGAWVLNYTNPMSILCLAAARAVPGARVVGLCHSVQGASHALASWCGVPYHEMRWNCAGVNHLAWFTELSHNGRDLYPALKEKVRTDPDFAEQDLVRFDLMKHFGYYLTETSGHDSEYLPYYRKNPAVLKRYCRDGYRGGSRYYASNWPQWRVACDNRRRAQIAAEPPARIQRSWEYASFIIQAMETNTPFVIYGNVPNAGLIDNLPQDGVVEVACLVDRRGVQGTHFGRLPAQCAALCDWNMRFFDLAAEACVQRSIPLAAQALMLDPLTAAVSCPADILQMTQELYQAERDYLPGFTTG